MCISTAAPTARRCARSSWPQQSGIQATARSLRTGSRAAAVLPAVIKPQENSYSRMHVELAQPIDSELSCWLSDRGYSATLPAAPHQAAKVAALASVLAWGTPPPTQLCWAQLTLLNLLFDDALEPFPAAAAGTLAAADALLERCLRLATAVGSDIDAAAAAVVPPLTAAETENWADIQASQGPVQSGTLLLALQDVMCGLWDRLDAVYGPRPWPAWLQGWAARFTASQQANFAGWAVEHEWEAAGYRPEMQEYAHMRVLSYGSLWALDMRELRHQPGWLECAAGGAPAAAAAAEPSHAFGATVLDRVLRGEHALPTTSAAASGTGPSASQLLGAVRTLLTVVMALQNDVLSAAKEAAHGQVLNAVLLLAPAAVNRKGKAQQGSPATAVTSTVRQPGTGSCSTHGQLAAATAEVVGLVDALLEGLAVLRLQGERSIPDSQQRAAFLEYHDEAVALAAEAIGLQAELLRDRYGSDAAAVIPPAWLAASSAQGVQQ